MWRHDVTLTSWRHTVTSYDIIPFTKTPYMGSLKSEKPENESLPLDLWPWLRNSSEMLSRSIPMQISEPVCQMVWLWECWRTDRQTETWTDGKMRPILLPPPLTREVKMFTVYWLNIESMLWIHLLSTPVLMHGGLLCIAFCPSVRLSVCDLTKIQTRH